MHSFLFQNGMLRGTSLSQRPSTLMIIRVSEEEEEEAEKEEEKETAN